MPTSFEHLLAKTLLWRLSKHLHQKGVGIKHGAVITENKEHCLWKAGNLREDLLKALLHTIFFDPLTGARHPFLSFMVTSIKRNVTS